MVNKIMDFKLSQIFCKFGLSSSDSMRDAMEI